MDAIDRKILAVVQDDASLSVAEIGQRVGLSSTPCWKRLQRLEADGVILRRVALVAPEKIGLGITVFVSVETSGVTLSAWPGTASANDSIAASASGRMKRMAESRVMACLVNTLLK